MTPRDDDTDGTTGEDIGGGPTDDDVDGFDNGGGPQGEPDIPALAKQRDVETVYQPAEDSELLATAVIERLEDLKESNGAGPCESDQCRVLDVGTGSGYVAARLREQTGASVVGSDVNPDACRQAFAAGVAVVRADLVSPFRADSFDVVVCNPPYLPTPPEQEWDDWMEAALSGGEDGREMIAPFLDSVGRVLGPRGRAFLLISTLTGPDEVKQLAREGGLEPTLVEEQSVPFERLQVYELVPRDEYPGRRND